jgi:dipeptide/tripeptide permease
MGEIMAAILGAFIALLLSPDIVVVALIAGWFARAWWHVLAGAVVAAVVHELLMSMMQITRGFDLGVWLIAVVAAAVWASAVYLLRQRRRLA